MTQDTRTIDEWRRGERARSRPDPAHLEAYSPADYRVKQARQSLGMWKPSATHRSAIESATAGLRIAETKRVVHLRGLLPVFAPHHIPEQIPGIPTKGEVYAYIEATVGLLDDGPTAVYAAGNVLTGKGNIKDSLESGTFVGIHVAESYLGLNGDDVPLAEGARKEAEHQGERIAEAMKSRPGLGPQQVGEVIRRVRERQRAIGYEGNYRAWIKRMTPVDLH